MHERPESNQKETSDVKLRDILQSSQPVVFKNINVEKDKERPKLFYLKETKETW